MVDETSTLPAWAEFVEEFVPGVLTFASACGALVRMLESEGS
jgi:hypothetical protein